MKAILELKSVVALFLAAVIITGCGGGAPVAIADLPVYAGATELKADNSAIAKTLQNNEAQAKALGQKIEQKGFALPKDASWDKVKTFYTDSLKAKGWSEGLGGGGLAGGLANDITSKALGQVNSANDSFQTTFFSKGNQTLALIRLAGVPSKDDVQLLLSLNSK